MREFVDAICQELQTRLPTLVVEFDGQQDAVVIDGHYLWAGQARGAVEREVPVEQCVEQVLHEFQAAL